MDWEVQEGPDIEMSIALSVSSWEVDFIKFLMEEFDCLLIDFQFHSVANRMVDENRYILNKFKQVKRTNDLLDRSNVENVQRETIDDRMRVIVANLLRLKHQKSMTHFQGIRNIIASEHKELLEKNYITVMWSYETCL
ncbi:hypothetical protein KY285_023679 [Solanum tuberosum]|nr:hypothetical protein KY289_024005 [Solanum tuberosum]KAH0675878.1 hypothetical protein KY285_023679 [Solanum tuberosum]